VNDTKSRCVTVCENSAKEKGINFDWPNEKFSYEVEPVSFNFLKSLKKIFWGSDLIFNSICKNKNFIWEILKC